MPAPTSAQIEAMASGALQGAGLGGEHIPNLAAALGQCLGQALTLFMSMAMVMPGIPAAVDPITGSGSTAGPGMLMPPPAGGPVAAQLEPLALGALSSKQLQGEKAPALAKAIASSTAQALTLFTSMVQVAPGMTVAGFVTVAPGMLMGAAPSKPVLQPIVLGLLQAEGLLGENIPDLASALAETLAQALGALKAQVQVSPGIASTPAATTTPGRLL